MPNNVNDKLKKIRSGRMQRALSLAKVSLSGAAKAGWQQLSNPFLPVSERSEAWDKYLLAQANLLTSEMSKLKGTVMKAGQMLSMHGERFFPPEVNRVLKTLQSQSLALEWNAVEQVMHNHLGTTKMSELAIDHEPTGAASLGQVHAATVTSTGERIALKVKYPGIDNAIESDLQWLRGLLKVSRFLPFTPALDQIFEEARRMLHFEVDYERERILTNRFREALRKDKRFVVPRTIPDYCNEQILATSFEEGLLVDDARIAALSQERRNRLGIAFLELYLRELFELKMVQSDAHFGNFRIRLDPNGVNDQWVLFDFGAVRELGEAFVTRYRALIRGAVHVDGPTTRKALEDLGMLDAESPADYSETLLALCFLGTEPVRFEGEYDWGNSDLPERAASFLPRLAFRSGIRLPPAEMLSLDRKVGGVFIILSKLRARFDSRALAAPYLKE